MNGETSNLDDKYMYEFCTKRCSWKDCPKDVTCYDAHSKAMSRRVPKQLKSLGGLFNYIPEHCPQYKWKKRCSAGESCFRAHGWLEVIFHPLLYKTKLCKSTHENGACRLYGIYCAKAHKRSEMRNLAKIYGKNWKAHYDTSQREVLQRPIGNFIGKSIKEGVMPYKLRPGVVIPPNSRVKEYKIEGSNEVIDNVCGSSSLRSSMQSLTVSESSESLPSQTSVLSPLDFNLFRTHYGEEKITNYTDLYDTAITEGQDRYTEQTQSSSRNQFSLKTASKVKRPSNRFLNGWYFRSEELNKLKDLYNQEQTIAQMLSSDRNLLKWTGQEKSYGRKLLKRAMRRKKGHFGGAYCRKPFRC